MRPAASLLRPGAPSPAASRMQLRATLRPGLKTPANAAMGLKQAEPHCAGALSGKNSLKQENFAQAGKPGAASDPYQLETAPDRRQLIPSFAPIAPTRRSQPAHSPQMQLPCCPMRRNQVEPESAPKSREPEARNFGKARTLQAADAAALSRPAIRRIGGAGQARVAARESIHGDRQFPRAGGAQI